MTLVPVPAPIRFTKATAGGIGQKSSASPVFMRSPRRFLAADPVSEPRPS